MRERTNTIQSSNTIQSISGDYSVTPTSLPLCSDYFTLPCVFSDDRRVVLDVRENSHDNLIHRVDKMSIHIVSIIQR